VFAAAISRWALRIDGMLRERIYLKYPAAPDLINGVDRTGMLPPLHEGGFTAFCHRPGELRDEIAEAGLEVTDLVSVEGPAFILGDLDARMADPVDRSVALEVARAIERVPELAGFGPHLIATAIRSLACIFRDLGWVGGLRLRLVAIFLWPVSPAGRLSRRVGGPPPFQRRV
jgi:hypothetical protein